VITDPRNTDWFWLRTPEPSLLVVAAYLVFVVVGPRVMASRPPLNIRSLIVAYNFAMVALSTYMSAEVGLRRSTYVTRATLCLARVYATEIPSVCLSVCCVTFAESEPYCHSILFVCLDVCRSFHDLQPTTID